MKTRISCLRNQAYELVVDDGKKDKERRVLAGMTLFEGTGLWMLTDIRLHRYRQPSAYSGGLFADDVSCYYKPKDDDELKLVRGLLREFTVDQEGAIYWSSFEGLVRGPRRGGTWSRTDHNGIGYFSKAEGMAYLKEIQKFWDVFEGDPAAAKIENPNLQPSETQVSFKVFFARHPNLGPELAVEDGFDTPAPGL